MNKYILKDGKPILENDIIKWSEWFEMANRYIAENNYDDVRVSTVFLGLDHGFNVNGPPVLFETMVFGGKHDGYQERYETKEQAIKGHKIACAMVGKDNGGGKC